jgi:hypothetical protein
MYVHIYVQEGEETIDDQLVMVISKVGTVWWKRNYAVVQGYQVESHN